MHCSQEVLEAVKPKKIKLGKPLESESMRRKSSSQPVAETSSVNEDENETDMTVEIEVGLLPSFSQLIFTGTIFPGAKSWNACQPEGNGEGNALYSCNIKLCMYMNKFILDYDKKIYCMDMYVCMCLNTIKRLRIAGIRCSNTSYKTCL